MANAHAITTRLLPLALALALVAPVAAQEAHYEYEDRVTRPVTITGPGYALVRLELPPGVEGLMLTPHLKSCEAFGGAPIEDDAFVHMHSVKAHPDKYQTTVKISDLKPGRTQTYCPRLRYVPWSRLLPGHE